MRIAIVGGSGDLGAGLAKRWALAGHEVIIGSRHAERAAEAARLVGERTGGASVTGAENVIAAQQAELVVLTVPYANHAATLEQLAPHVAGKILVDVTVPLNPPKVRTVALPAEGSAARAAQLCLGDDVRVVSAFQNVAAAHLNDIDHAIDCDVLVCGNDREARDIVIALARDAGMTAWHAGRIENSAVTEAMTSALIFINSHYKIPGAGIRITGTPRTGSEEG